MDATTILSFAVTAEENLLQVSWLAGWLVGWLIGCLFVCWLVGVSPRARRVIRPLCQPAGLPLPLCSRTPRATSAVRTSRTATRVATRSPRTSEPASHHPCPMPCLILVRVFVWLGEVCLAQSSCSTVLVSLRHLTRCVCSRFLAPLLPGVQVRPPPGRQWSASTVPCPCCCPAVAGSGLAELHRRGRCAVGWCGVVCGVMWSLFCSDVPVCLPCVTIGQACCRRTCSC